MKTVGNLCCLRNRLAGCGSVVASSIAAHEFNFWVSTHPGSSGLSRSIGQEVNHLVGFQLHEDGPEPSPPPKRKIVYPKLRYLLNRDGGKSHDASENGLARGLYSQTIRHTDARSATGGQANDLHDLKEPCSDTGPRGDKGGQTLSEDFSYTGGRIAEKFPNREQEVHGLPSTGKIGQLSLIATMNTSGRRATQRTTREGLRGKERHAQCSLLG